MTRIEELKKEIERLSNKKRTNIETLELSASVNRLFERQLAEEDFLKMIDECVGKLLKCPNCGKIEDIDYSFLNGRVKLICYNCNCSPTFYGERASEIHYGIKELEKLKQMVRNGK